MKTVTSLQMCFSILVSVGLMACCVKASGGHMVGGLSEDIKPADKEVQQLVDGFKEELGSKYKTLTAISYRTQVVAGLNYFIKVKAETVDGKEEILHLRIYKHFKNQPQLTKFLKDQNLETPIEHF